MDMFDARTGKVVTAFTNQEEWVLSIAFSPDGQWIASGSTSAVCIFDVTMEKRVGSSGLDQDFAASVNFSPNGQQVVSGNAKGIICVWDANPVEGVLSTIALFDRHFQSIDAVVFSPDGKQIASGHGDGTIGLWNMETGIAAMQRRDETVDDDILYNKPDNGWVRGRNYWVPPENREGLWDRATIWIVGMRTTRLDFSSFVHGEDWESCYAHATNT
jgi:WD40 repeat protein